MLFYPARCIKQEMGTLVFRWTWSATILGLGVIFKQCSVGVQSLPREFSPHHYTISSLIHLYKAGWIQGFTLTLPSKCYRTSRNSKLGAVHSPREQPLARFLSLLQPFHYKPRDDCVGKSQEICSFRNTLTNLKWCV